MFKVGDRIVYAISYSGYWNTLEIGETYTIDNVFSNTDISVKECDQIFPNRYFVLALIEIRKQKLEKINEKSNS